MIVDISPGKPLWLGLGQHSAAGYRGKDYAGHSFWIGVATTASRCGIQIKTQGRWESAAYTTYMKTAPEVLCKVSKTLLQNLEHAPRT